MDMKWPEDYQERIEAVLGSKYNEKKIIYFLDFDFKTTREAKDCKTKTSLMQKQLRQIKSEINNKINVFRAQRLTRATKKSPYLLKLATISINLSVDNKISKYQYVILNIDKLLDACEKRKNEIETRIEQQKLSLSEGSINRDRIPDDVQVFVWNRDKGKCVKCGSQRNLEFDHIIPLSKGGSNTARNIQLLCESCNRVKSDGIGE